METRAICSIATTEASVGRRVALVTGGRGGIGAAIAEALLAAGYRVAVDYAHDHAAADAFATRTDIPVFAGTSPIPKRAGKAWRASRHF